MRVSAVLMLIAPLAFAAKPNPLTRSAGPTFEPNAGQVAKSVQWVVRHGAATPMFLRASGAAIAHRTAGAVEFVEMRVDGARPDAPSAGEEPLASYSNYYLGRDARSWFTGIPHFARVRYKDVYPGIDVVYRVHDGRIEYDFDVHPGADPSQIHISFHGVDGLRTRDGDLILTTRDSEFRQLRPRTFQDGIEIASSYKIDRAGRVEIALAAHDPARRLLIDPVLQFASYLGGPGVEDIGAIKVDSQGYLYLAAESTSIVSPTLDPFVQSGLTVTSPCIFKFTPDGSHLVFVLTLAVDNKTYLDGIAIDGSGNILVTGETAALQLPLKNPIDATFNAKLSTTFASKWAADGRALVYSTYFGGSGNEYAAGAAVDTAGNLWIAGTTSSTDLPTRNALQPTHAGGLGLALPYRTLWASGGATDCFAAKLSPQGQLLFSTYLGGSGDEDCRDMALAPDGDLVLADSSSTRVGQPGFPMVNAMLSTPPLPFSSVATARPQGGVIAKLRSDGQSLAFSTYVGQSDAGAAIYGYLYALAVDPSGNIYFGGSCDSGLVTKNAIQPTNVRANNAVSKASAWLGALDVTGQNILYTTYLDGNASASQTLLQSMAADAQGSVYVTSTTTNSDFPVKNSLQGFNGGGASSDFFLARLSPAGAPLLFSTFLGGSGQEYHARVTTGPDGSAYFAGSTQSIDVPLQNPFQAKSGGNYDLVFMKFTDTPLTAGPASNITAIGGGSQIVTPSSPFPVELQARVTDSAGIPVGGATVNFSAPASPATAFLSSTSAVTNSAGIASVAATASLAPGTYTVTATTPGVARSASFTLTNAAPNVTVQTSPPGVAYTVDNITYNFARGFAFAEGSVHTLSAGLFTPNGDGRRAAFVNWSDGLAGSHAIVATASPVTYTANFTQQYQLTTTVSPAGSGTVTPDSGGYYDAGSTVTLTAAPTGTQVFSSWTGPVTSTGPRTGTVTMNAPVAVIANFAPAGSPTLSASASSLTFTASAGGGATDPQPLTISTTASRISATVSIAYTNPLDPQWLKLSATSGATPFTINATADPTGLAAGAYQATISLTAPEAANSPLSIPVTFTITSSVQLGRITALVNAATYLAAPTAPNELLTAFGTFPGCESFPAQVTVGPASAEVLYSSAGQVNFLMPAGITIGARSSLQIGCQGGIPTPFALDVAASSPGLFTQSQDGKGQAAVVNQDGSVNTPSPAGSYIAVYGTGFGAYNATSPDGLTRLSLPVTAALSPVAGSGPTYPATVLFAGQAPTYTRGLQQINLQIPAGAPAGTMQLILTAGSPPNQAQTQTGVTLQIAAAPANSSAVAQPASRGLR